MPALIPGPVDSRTPRQRADAAGPLPHSALIEKSHQRCAALGLKRIERPDFEPMVRGDLAVARDRNLRLSSHAAPVMQLLAEQIVNTESMIVLTDAGGTILHTVGDADFLERARKVALLPGVNWAEHSKGTNAIGTTLFEETPTLVHAGEHFMHANGFLTCSAAPIFDPRGAILGVLDVTGDQRSYHQHTMGLVRMSARMIENHWLTEDYRHRMRLHFHHRVEFIGTLLEGIVVVGMDGRVLGANRSAIDLLQIGDAALRLQTVGELFGTSVAAVADHFRAPLALPMTLRLADGRQFYLQARFSHDSLSALPAAQLAGLPSSAAPSAMAVTAATAAPPLRPSGLHYLLTGDAQVQLAVDKIARVRDRDIALLVFGEAGTGKQLLARAVHHDSARARQPFVSVDCAAQAGADLEAELFGPDDAAAGGARRLPGRILQANGGTLFLAAIDMLALPLQARLLRVLRERQVAPAGSLKAIAIDIAIVGSSRGNLLEAVQAGAFLADLYYQLDGLAVRWPALRERSDLAALVQRLLTAAGPGDAPRLHADLLERFRAYHWPGNLRQLGNVLRTAAVMAAGEPFITDAHLSDDFLEDLRRVHATAPTSSDTVVVPSGKTLGEQEVDTIREALALANGNISLASKRLGISRNTIYRKLRWNQG
jgi:transcriptional regulator of acetoin/glycerol metabolism